MYKYRLGLLPEHNGAGTIFGQGGQDRERQNRVRKTEFYAGTRESFCPENKRSPKKVFTGFVAFFLVRIHRFSK